MNEYRIERCAGAPDWEHIPALRVSAHPWQPDCAVTMTQQLCHDGRAIYVRQLTNETGIRAEHDGALCPVWEDSCMEFFFMPDGEDRYVNFEINPNGSIFLGIGHGREDRVRLVPAGARELFRIRTRRDAGGWEARYALPLDFLRLFYPSLRLDRGTALRANCYKCGDLTPAPHYLCWNPVNAPAPDFHRPEAFGRMVLG